MQQQTQLSLEKDFVVGESSFLNYLISGLCLPFIISAFAISQKSFGVFFMIFALAGMAVAHLIKGIKRTSILVINRKGIYYFGRFLTNWENFTNAYYREVTKADSKTNYKVTYLFLKYYSVAKEGNVVRKIELTNTQNRSEEEIIAAIKFFYDAYKNQ